MSCGLVRLIAEPTDNSDWRTNGLPVVEDVEPGKAEQARSLLELEGHTNITEWQL